MNKKSLMSACLSLSVMAFWVQPASAQGVPVIDSTNLAKNIEQLQTALRDIEKQVEQIEQLKAQVQQLTDLNQLTDKILGSITGPWAEIADLYNTAQDIRSRAAKITDLSGLTSSLSAGDFSSILDKLLDGNVTVGGKNVSGVLTGTLESAGFTEDRLTELSSDKGGQGVQIANTAAANATSMVASQMAYEEAGESLERIDGLVDEIAKTDTLKESVDLNTRMAAETNYMLGSMWRLNAANGLANGQNGINWAGEMSKQEKFFQMGDPE